MRNAQLLHAQLLCEYHPALRQSRQHRVSQGLCSRSKTYRLTLGTGASVSAPAVGVKEKRKEKDVAKQD